MAKRIYSVGIIDDVRWSKSSGTDPCSSPICIQQIQPDASGLEEITKHKRHSSTPSVAIGYPSIPRIRKNSSAALSVHIQSMKKSAFKMLCKFI
jgi:hypothetical protein